ncbi:hypothetical protein JL720_7209 [Aureococcus anophagefferens]|nr:hypothetical protein JL720_7209 [Aureococcus anophagefferens]
METLRARARMCYRVIRDAKRRAGAGKPRAEDDECPAYYGVDYKEESGKSVCKFTEALRSLENAFSEFMPERFYGIDDRGRYQGKVAALAVVPGSGSGSSGLIVFGLYDSKVEVAPPRAQAAREFLALFDESEVEMAAAMFDSRPIEIARPLLFESEEDAERRAEPAAPKRKRKSRKKKRKAAAAAAAAAAAERGDEAAPAADGAAEPAAAPEAPAEAPAASPPTAPPVEAPAEAPAPAAAPAKKKKKKRSRRRGPAPPAEISEYERTRMRNIAAGNKKLYSLGLIHPPPASSPTPSTPGAREQPPTAAASAAELRDELAEVAAAGDAASRPGAAGAAGGGGGGGGGAAGSVEPSPKKRAKRSASVSSLGSAAIVCARRSLP